ncbi:FMN-dependent NADH-azoreductase [Woodsholea maritima]|uniref:FMN-dependent NADH-azoreductase n=1 Tax=Woodsholea maritima TaxID=240237 RepID=UPI000365DD4F|nr:NAD(P)H-dependent oxidoreductase [Woodsholea maritima]
MTQNLLYISSSARDEGSITRASAQALIAAMAQPDTSLVERDVAKSNLPYVDATWVGANFTPAEARTPEHIAALALSETLIEEIEAADTLVIGVSVYNFNLPASLKAWIDLIVRARRTFHYEADGPVGHLTGKRAIIAYGSGGTPLGSAMDFASPYLRAILGYIGITDVTFVDATGWGRLSPEARAALIDRGVREAFAHAA